MGCLKRNKTGTIVGATATNGKPSMLFNELKTVLGSTERAVTVYNELRDPKWKEKFGKDWEAEVKEINATDSLYLDKNGEPKLISGFGKYYFRSFKGTDINLELKQREDTGLTYDQEIAFADTAISFIIDRMEKNPEYFQDTKKVKGYFNKTEESEKGLLAEDLLLEAFEGIEDPAIAKQLFNIYKSTRSISQLKNALPEGVNFKPAGKIFLVMYDKWNDVINPRTQNVERVGWRTIIKNRLPSFGIQLKDKVGEIEEFEDDPIKIYGQSRLEVNPSNTLSNKARNILGRIKSSEPNILGYQTYLPMDEVYGVIAEATVGQNLFSGYINQVGQAAKYKPYLYPIVEKLNNLTASERASLYSNFRLAYKNFILFSAKQNRQVINPLTGEEVITVETRMYSSNQSNSGKKSLRLWREQSVEKGFDSPRAAYTVEQNKQGDDLYTLKPAKQKAIKSAVEKINKVQKLKVDDTIPSESIDGLATALWELGIQYGDTYQETRDNLEKYFKLGNSKQLKGVPLFKDLVFGKNGVQTLFNVLRNPNINIYRSNLKTLKKLAAISHLFENRPFGSFISLTGKQYYPINLPNTLDDFRDDILDHESLVKLIDERMKDPFFSPGTDLKYTSVLTRAFLNGTRGDNNYLNNFDVNKLDGYKSPNEAIPSSDYENQSSKTSLIVRLNAFANSGNTLYTNIAIPTQADRGTLDFMVLPRMERLKSLGIDVTRRDILEGLILQDLARINQANKQISEAQQTGDFTQLKEGYHYKLGSAPLARDGSVFTMTQISKLTDDVVIGDSNLGVTMSELVEDYILEKNAPESDKAFLNSKEGLLFQTKLDEKVANIEERLNKYAEDLKAKIEEYKIKLIQDVQFVNKKGFNKQAQDKFINEFVFNDFVGKIEIVKHIRGGFNWSKNTPDFYKRMGHLQSPGQKLYIKDNTSNNPDYGMMPTFNEITIADFDFQNSEFANAVADRMFMNLVASGVNELKAKTISDKYRNVNKTDAQGLISLPMYRGIQMGLGQWDMKLDEQAYKNAMKKEGEYAGLYVDNKGNPRTIIPIKPYYEDLSLRNGTTTLIMNKNSYLTVTPELAANYPALNTILNKMNQGIHVVNTRSATKGSRQNVIDLQREGTLDNATVIEMDSSKLRLPQIIPTVKKDNINFSIQVRKALVANIDRQTLYNLDGKGEISGEELYYLYHDLISENIKQDLDLLKTEIGLNELENTVQKFGMNSLQHKEAKLDHLKKLQGRLREQIQEKGLSKNYENALDIVPNGQYDYSFRIPLSFPNYQAKFEQTIMGMFNKRVIKQSINGSDLVQIAELGGYTEQTNQDITATQFELEMYDGINPAQVRIKASALGLDPGVDIKTVDPKLLNIVGYRTPNQVKSSSLAMEVVGFLPESHSKAIMVPGGITVQMGSDFDIDKLSIMIPNHKKGARIVPDYNQKISNMSRPMRDNAIMDIYQTIMLSEQHREEIQTPLDSDLLPNLARDLRRRTKTNVSVDYNNPLAEIEMEERNKASLALRGLWANQLAGRNIAQTGNMGISVDYAPILNDNTFDRLGVIKDSKGNYTDYNISLYLSSAVDAAKDPIQIDINDNIYTVPVAGLMLSAGIPVTDVVYFLAQPVIKEVINIAKTEALTIDNLNIALERVSKRIGKEIDKSSKFHETFITPMISEELRLLDNNLEKQFNYLNNFRRFFYAGRRLQTINKVITPDNLKNINEISSLVSWLETEDRFLRDADSGIIYGAEDMITKNKINERDINPIAAEFRSTFDKILSSMDEIGFINNRDSFHTFKRGLKNELGLFGLTPAQHKFIDRALFLELITRPNSPLITSNLISENTFNYLYTNKNQNIASLLQNMKIDYPKLVNNAFVSLLKPHPNNIESVVSLIQLDNSFDTSSTFKNKLSDGLLDLLKNPKKYANDPNNKNEVKKIKEFGKLLIANQIFTTGFAPGFGTYIDLIPSQVFTDPTLLFETEGTESLVEFFNRESVNTFNSMYFSESNEIHKFVRNFAAMKPGGKSLLKTIPYNRIKKQLESKNYDGEIQMTINEPKIYNERLGFVGYFITNSPQSGSPKVFVRKDIILQGNAAIYEELQQAGIPGKLNEVGLLNNNSNSLVNTIGNVNSPGDNIVKNRQRGIIPNSEKNPEQQPFKGCFGG
tara:strand:- start:5093 stop:11518 length:6426 start_codon:yes stop_codon:yes gene_type:complete